MYRYSTFVVRIQLDSDNKIVGGQISAVTTQETAHFRDLSKAVAFIENHVRDCDTDQSPGKTNGHTVVPEVGSGDTAN